MKRQRNSVNCFAATATFLAVVFLLNVFNILNSFLPPLQVQVKTNTKSGNTIQPLSSVELYYLDKYGYRIALQSEAAEYNGKEHRSLHQTRPTTTESPLNGYDVMHGENEAEKDETIDYNFNLPETTNQGEVIKKRPKCSEKNPVKQLVLLKTHRTGSSTLANILYRYGDLNDLDFALPKRYSYEYYWPVPFNPSFVEKQYMNASRPPHMLVNARLRPNLMALLKSQGSFLITVLRDPITHFESSFYSNHLDYLFGLEKTSNPLSEFLKSPRQSFAHYLKNEKKIDTKLNLAVNGQMFDLGLKRIHFSDEKVINRTIEELNETVDLMLISEYMDESLILLKRALCWDIDDVLYFTHKQRHKDYKDLEITREMADQIYQWNQADGAMYKYFKQTLWKKISEQDNSFFEELQELRLRRLTLEKECLTSSSIEPETGEILFQVESDLSSLNKYLCEKMNTNEKDYITYLKTKARLKFQEEDDYIKKQFQELEDRFFNSSSS